MWVLEGAERAGLAVEREPGSVISGCLAEIDPINAPIGGLSLLGLIATRWRQGPGSLADVHETARLRWIGNSLYRPRPLAPFADEIEVSLRERTAA
jgi:hypothetical protein